MPLESPGSLCLTEDLNLNIQYVGAEHGLMGYRRICSAGTGHVAKTLASFSDDKDGITRLSER